MNERIIINDELRRLAEKENSKRIFKDKERIEKAINFLSQKKDERDITISITSSFLTWDDKVSFTNDDDIKNCLLNILRKKLVNIEQEIKNGMQ